MRPLRNGNLTRTRPLSRYTLTVAGHIQTTLGFGAFRRHLMFDPFRALASGMVSLLIPILAEFSKPPFFLPRIFLGTASG